MKGTDLVEMQILFLDAKPHTEAGPERYTHDQTDGPVNIQTVEYEITDNNCCCLQTPKSQIKATSIQVVRAFINSIQ